MLQETEGTTESNLISRSTTKELVSDAALVLGSGAILDPVAINTTHHTWEVQAYAIVCLRGIVV